MAVCIRIPCIGERLRKEMNELRLGVWSGRAEEEYICILDTRGLNRVPGLNSHTKWLSRVV